MKKYKNFSDLKQDILPLIKDLYAHQLWLQVYLEDGYNPIGRIEAGKDIPGQIRYISFANQWLSGAASLKDFTVRPFLHLTPKNTGINEIEIDSLHEKLKKDWDHAFKTIRAFFREEEE